MSDRLSDQVPIENSGFAEGRSSYVAASFDELCVLATNLLSMSAAAVMLYQDGLCRLVGNAGLPVSMRSFNFDYAKSPYKPEQTYVLADARDNTFAQTFGHEFGISGAGALIRMPLDIRPEYNLVLVLFNAEPISKPRAQTLKLLSEAAHLVKEQLQSVVDLLVQPGNDITIAKTLDDVKTLMRTVPRAALLLDAQLRIVEVNAAAAKMIDPKFENLIGLTHKEISPETADAVHFLYHHALATMISPPDFEIIIGEVNPRLYRISVTPFSPTDTRDYFLFINVDETTNFAARSTALEKAIDVAQPIILPKDPSQVFLFDTLVRRRTIRQCKKTNYLVLRAWRQSIKPYQISALKALKQNIPPNFARDIASEIAGEVESLFGIGGFRAIVPMPCGHSRGPSCLSLEIARSLAHKTGLPVIQAFISEPIEGVSHPKENTKRPPMKMVRIIKEPVLLVDDVATSGSHIEEAVTMLKQTSASVLAIAWIGGDVAEKSQD